MKHLKHILVAALTMFVAFALAVPAFASSIEVQDVLDGETYTAYKILNYTKNGEAYSYYLTSEQYDAIGSVLEGAGFIFQRSADGSQYYVTNADQEATDPVPVDAAAAAAYLGEHVSELGNALGTFEATGADEKAEFSGLGTGYYFVTSSMGSLCALHDDDGIATVVEKNTTVTDEKEVDEDSEYAQVGDILHYTVTLTDGKGTNLAAKITDTMSAGLTYNNDAVVTVPDKSAGAEAGARKTLVKDTDYTISTSGNTVVVYTISADVMTELDDGDQVIVTYSATVNSDASLDGTESNTEFTEYSKQETDGKTVDVTFTDLTVNKTDGTDALKGAQFKLYRTDEALELDHVDVKLRELTDAELVAAGVTKAANTVYYTVDPNTGTNLIDMAQKDGDNYKYSSAVVYGLDKDSTYYLEETKAPEGYNLLAEEKEVDLGNVTDIDVVNNAGTELPSTGGMGTTILYIVGSVLVVGGVAALITKRRLASEK